MDDSEWQVIEESVHALFDQNHLPLIDWHYCESCETLCPPRSHHCEVCGVCVLRMDHHCPWVGNCIGYNNHKFFWNFLLHTFLGCAISFIAEATVMVKVTVSWRIGIAMKCSALLTIILAILLGFHTYYLLTNKSSRERVAYAKFNPFERT
jgi:palmitoyltransferase